ncbi:MULTISPECIES: oligosaccharide flippase family protein [Shewanella]|uniref:oligosaccharide flippase family protein n=1 Tax=Shewanella TaxID=22 RepID=UPI00048E4BDF|nr:MULTISPECIES: oligosaccharide flippase family protein [Shewanella]MDL2195598.1 oligosaccharide flippase family protein [Shewanella algae]
MREHTIKYLVAEIITKALPFLLIPYFTSKLGASGYGELSLFQVYFNLFIVLITVGGDTLLTRVVFRYGKFIFNEFTAFLIIIYFVISTLLIAPIYYWGGELFVFSFICALVFVINNIFLIRFQSLTKSSDYLTSQILNALLSTILTLVLFEIYLQNYQSRALAVFISYVIIVLYFIVKEFDSLWSGRSFYKRINIYLSMFLIIGSPMLLHKLSFFIRNQLDRVVVYKFFTVEELGVYSLSAQLVSILPVVFTAINMALYPVIYSNLKNRPKFVFFKIGNLLPYIIIACVLVSFISTKIPSDIYVFLFGNDFKETSYFFPILFFGNSLQIVYLLLSTVVLYFLKTKSLAFCTVVASVIHLCALYIIAPYGIQYVPYVVIISNITSLLLVYWFCYMPLKKKYCE